MRLYGAIDLHSNNSVVVVTDEADNLVEERRLPNSLPAILGLLAPYRKQIESVAVESTFNWYWLVDGLRDAGYEVKLVNTFKVKMYDDLKYTDDESDARHLAHLLRLNILPMGYIYPEKERPVRDLLRKRGHLVQARTSQLLSIQNMVARNTGSGISVEDIYELDDSAIEKVCSQDKYRALAMRACLDVVHCLDEQITKVEKAVLAHAKLRPEFRRLRTIKGVGEILAMTIMLEVGTIERFKTVGDFASYCRCVKSVRFSNGHKKGDGNRKNGNRYLGWAFIEAANFAIRFDERIRRFYQRKKAKSHLMVARKAVAHKLARAVFHMLKDQRDFQVELAFS